MIIGVIGLIACRFALVRRGEDEVLDSHLMQALALAIALLTVASIGILVSRTLEMNRGQWSSLGDDVGTVLSVTHYGSVWIWRVPALVLLWLAWMATLRYHQDKWTGWLMLAAVALVAMTRSDTGHAADAGDFHLMVWVDWLHLLAAGAWVGSLFGMALVVFPQLVGRGAVADDRSAAIFQRLSTLSGFALAVLLGAGIYMALQQLTHFSDLWRTQYGIALDVKIAVVLGMMFIGAWNRYIRLPRLLLVAGRPVSTTPVGRLFRFMLRAPLPYPVQRSGTQLRSCAGAVLAESLLGVVVIGAAAVLLHAMPPSDVRSMPAMVKHSASTMRAAATIATTARSPATLLITMTARPQDSRATRQWRMTP